MTSFDLKIIAVVAMLCDHVGFMLFPECTVLRMIGRIAMPLFCFLLVQGFFHTGNKTKYFFRLLVFSVISEIPFDLMRYGKDALIDRNFSLLFGKQNFMFTLLLGFCMMCICELIVKNKSRWLHIFIIPILLAGCAASFFLKVEYSFFGMMLIAGFYLFRGKRYFSSATLVASEIFSAWYNGNQLLAYGVMAVIPIFFYNGSRGKYSLKYFFYLFYPLHIILLYLIKIYIF